ncbi:LysE family translocator [Acuticoccus sediminis]|uniref:LysE family translocator n=1 Tax=Acuticoccus sediminis TaxID=2184697 RepID=A0A8B2NJS1_9HYPH|nr:LysE family translocator [Acuticoccus sediminis]RAH96096.1 LysE family translocator [Acuticoccus sediminis]
MDLGSLAALALYTVVMSITPGPNNVMLTTSGLAFGMRRTWPHLLGIPFGVTVQLVTVGTGLGAVFAFEPRIQLGLKLVGTLYLLWLAGKLWRAAELRDAPLARPIGFGEAAVFQFVNPKAWLIAVTVVASFLAPGEGYTVRLALVCAVFTVVGLPCMAVWAAFGAGLRKMLRDPEKLRFLNRAMAALAALTAGLFWI